MDKEAAADQHNVPVRAKARSNDPLGHAVAGILLGLYIALLYATIISNRHRAVWDLSALAAAATAPAAP